ncbi:MAG: 5'-nucleotidase C-terminal domain-containing protein [Firmicutes bacterium]|nr:5'-nucleotidase C-terminal domain-containing protein [Bacillota bacterium]
MLKNKKFLASGITAVAVAAAFVPAASAEEVNFSDVSTNYVDAVDFLLANGITDGMSETEFGTYSSVKRVDAAVMIARALNLDPTADYEDAGFKDVNARGAWAVNALVQFGILDGTSDTTFSPDAPLTRNQTAKLLANAAELKVNDNVTKSQFTDVNSNFAKYVDALVNAGITKGKDAKTFDAYANVTRGQLALFLDRAKEHFGYMDLMVMHTNDTHGYLDQSVYRASAIKTLRAQHENNILLDAGDVFSGDLYFNAFEGQADVAMMNYLGYDAMTFGNHEFDLGSSAEGHKSLTEFIKAANFPLISSNVDFSKDPLFAGLQSKTYASNYKDGHIYNGVILNVNGHEVGVFGLTTEETPSISSVGSVEFKNYIDSAKASVKAFEDLGVDKIIAVSHIGFDDSLNFDNDKELAKLVEGIDIIVGGHTHSALAEPFVSFENDAPTILVQANEYSKFLGTLDVTFNPWGEISTFNGELLKTDTSAYAIDEGAAKLLAPFKAEVEKIKTQSTGVSTDVLLDGKRAADTDNKSSVRFSETNLGNLMTDAMLAKAKTVNDKTVIALQNGGGIRASIEPGDITVGDVLKVMPFGNALAILELTGAEIKTALEHSVSQVPKENGAFLHVAGMKFEYDSSKAAGSRVTKVEVKTGADSFAPLEDGTKYFVATNTFTAKGGDGYEVFKKAYNEGRVSEPGIVDYTSFIDYIKTLDKVEPKVEGRIVDITKPAVQ